MSLIENIKSNITQAMKDKDAVRLATLRGVLSACTNDLVAKGKKPQDIPEDEDVLAVITRLAKQRKDSIDQFEKGGREDLAMAEEAELKILETYLPEMMSKDEVLARAKILQAELGIADKSGMGKLMSALMIELKGKADGMVVKNAVDEILS